MSFTKLHVWMPFMSLVIISTTSFHHRIPIYFPLNLAYHILRTPLASSFSTQCPNSCQYKNTHEQRTCYHHLHISPQMFLSNNSTLSTLIIPPHNSSDTYLWWHINGEILTQFCYFISSRLRILWKSPTINTYYP